MQCAYTPMVELLHYLRDNGFSTYIASLEQTDRGGWTVISVRDDWKTVF